MPSGIGIPIFDVNSHASVGLPVVLPYEPLRARHRVAPAALPARMHRTSPLLPASSIPWPGASVLQFWP